MKTKKTQNSPTNTGVTTQTTIPATLSQLPGREAFSVQATREEAHVGPHGPLSDRSTTPEAKSTTPPSTSRDHGSIDAYPPPTSNSENPQSAIRSPQLEADQSRDLEVQQLRDKVRMHEEEKMLQAGGIDKLLESRTEAMRDHFIKQIKELQANYDHVLHQLTEIKIDQAATVAASKHGLLPTAISDLTVRARSAFKLHNGNPIAFEPDGKTPKFGRNGQPLTLDEWSETLVTEAPHLFQPNKGSGSVGSGNTPPLFDNPWDKRTFNLTKQGQIWKQDRALAERLKVAAEASGNSVFKYTKG